jgi:hypothetical protein
MTWLFIPLFSLPKSMLLRYAIKVRSCHEGFPFPHSLVKEGKLLKRGVISLLQEMVTNLHSARFTNSNEVRPWRPCQDHYAPSLPSPSLYPNLIYIINLRFHGQDQNIPLWPKHLLKTPCLFLVLNM